MHEYLDGLSLSDVSALSGAKADTIKHWLHRGQLDQPPIYGKDRVFMAEHVLQVCLMKLLTASGIPAKKAGAEARRKAVDALQQLEAGIMPGEPLGAILEPHIAALQRYEAKQKSEDVARIWEQMRRLEAEIATREEWHRTWGNLQWVSEQKHKAEANGDTYLWLKCEQAFRDIRRGGWYSLPELRRRGRPIGSSTGFRLPNGCGR